MNCKNIKCKGIVFLLFVLMNSCIGYKKTLYFQGDQQNLNPPKLNETYLIRKGDLLKITINTPDAESKNHLDDNSSDDGGGEGMYFTSYYVNDSGYIDLAGIGKVTVTGFTIMQIDSLVTAKVQTYYNYASVDVKFGSFVFLALGEFNAPGQHRVANESCTIYEAMAIGGDATMFANKKKIQVIRTLVDGSKKVYALDLTDYSTFTSENYFIQPNDIIYIQPQRAKVDKQNVAVLSIGLSMFSIIVLILTRL